MATKFGEGYYEIFPRINQAAVAAARAAITKGMGDAFAKEQSRMRSEDDQTTRSRITNTNKVREREKTNINKTGQEERGLAAIRSKFSRDLDRDSKKNEGSLHRLATQFRTIGTILRGFSLFAAFTSIFNGIRIALGGIAALVPVINAGLVATPSLLASVGAEAIILKIAFRGVGTAIKDAFDPKRAKQYQQELQKLAPAARTFVKEIAALKHLKLPNLQQALFGNKTIQQTGKNLAPFVKALAPGAAKVAGASGGVIGTVTSELTGTRGITAFTFVLKSLAANLKAVQPGLKRFVDGFLTLIFHVSSLGNGAVGRAFSKWLGKIGDFVANVDVGKVFAKGKVAAHAFGLVLKDVWDILSGIFKALNTGQAWQGFTNVLHTIANFVNSGTGKIFLAQLSNSLSIISSLISSLTGSALKLIANAFAQFYPKIKPLADIIKKIGKDLEPLGTVIGVVIAGAFDALTRALQILEPWIKRTVGWLVAHKDEVGKIGGKLLLAFAAFAALKKLGNAVSPLIDGLKSLGPLASPTGLVVLGLAAIALGIYLAYKHSQTFRDGVKKLGDSLKALGKTLAPLKTLFKDWAWLAKNIALGFLIADVYALNAVIWVLVKTIAGLKRAFDNMKHWMLTGWNAVFAFFTKTLPSWFIAAKNWFVYSFNAITSHVHKWWSGFINFFTGPVKNFFVKTIPSFFLKMRDWFVYALNSVVSNLHKWWANVANFFTGKVKGFFVSTIPSWIAKFRDWVAYFLNKTRDIAKNFVEHDIIGNFNKMKNFFTKTVPGWLNTFKNAAVDTIKKTATGIWSAWTKVANFLWTPINFVVSTVYDKGIRGFWNATVGKIPGIGKALSLPNVKMPPKFQTGGHIRGPGGPTSDQVPIMASNNEYVINAAKVRKYGVKFFDHLNYGPDWTGDGSAGNRSRNVYDVGYKGGGVVGTIPDRVGATLAWLKSIAGRVPYVLGGNGPNSFDCSSLVGNVWARLTNNPVNRRYFVTGTENAWAAHHGFSKGSDPTGFTIGTNGEHTTGILAGHRFEAAHTGTKMRFDDGAMDARRFPSVWHMTGLTGLGGGIGYDPIIDKVLKGGLAGILGGGKGTYLAQVWNMIKNIPHPGVDKGAVDMPHGAAKSMANFAGHALFSLADKAKKLAQKALSNLGASFGNLISNKSLTSTVDTALQAAGAPQTWYGDVLKIIRGESGGNANAQNNTDINAQRGDPSQGLMQLTHSNFEHYRSKKLPNDPFNPLANVYAAIKYIQDRYVDIKYTPWISGKGRYYSQGGLVPTLFDSGGYLPPKSMTLAANNTSNWEKVGGGLPSKLVLDLGNNNTIEMMMDSRIAKHDDDIIRYVATH